VLLVTLSESGAPISVDRRRTGRHIWQTSRVDLGVLPDHAVVADQLEAITAGIETPAETVLRLTLDGTLDLAGRAALDAALERLEARLRHLEHREDGLTISASAADIEAFATEPLIKEAVAALVASDDPAAPAALRLLHATCQRLERG
jgi:ABC-type phosphate transport system auxiliary subunit